MWKAECVFFVNEQTLFTMASVYIWAFPAKNPRHNFKIQQMCWLSSQNECKAGFFKMHLKSRVVHLPLSNWKKLCCHDPCHQGHILSVSSEHKHNFCLFMGWLQMAPFNILNPTLFPLVVVASGSVCWGGVSRNLCNDTTVLVNGVEQLRPVIYSQSGRLPFE